jgi:putative membrane protein
LLAALSGDHYLVILITLIGVFSQAANLFSLIEVEGPTGIVVEHAFDAYLLPAFGIGGISLFIFMIIMGIFGTAIAYGGFKARRRGGRIEVEHGLFSRQYKGVSVTRVQSVQIRQGFIRRFIGYAELRLLTIDSMGDGSNQQNAQAAQMQGLVIHPFIKLNKVAGVLAGLTPEFNARPTEAEFKRLPKVAQRRSLIRRGIIPGLLYAAGVAVVIFSLILAPFASSTVVRTVSIAVGGLALLFIVLHIINAILWYRHAAFTFNSTTLMIRQGGYSQTTIIIPRKKIQWGATQQNPFQRLAKVATIWATTAAGVGGTTTKLRDLELADADSFFEWLRPRKQKQ